MAAGTLVIAPFVYWLAAFVLLGLACLLTKNEEWRAKCRRAMLIFVSSFVLWALVFSIGVQGRMSHSSALMEADRAELMLRLGTAFYVLEKHWIPHGGAPGGGVFSTKPAQQPAQQKNFHQDAKKILADSLTENPDSVLLKTKLAILLFDAGVEASHKEAMKLVHELASRQVPKDRDLGQALLTIYGQSKLAASQEDELKQFVDGALQPGWYRDACLLRLYKVTADKARYDELHDRIEQRAAAMLMNGIYLLVVGLVVVLLGLIVIVVQLFLLPGREAAEQEDAYWRESPAWDLRTVYVVLISWLASEISCGSLAQWILKTTGVTGSGILAVAVSTAGTYVLSNAPALFYIYWFACRPFQVRFRDAIRLKFHSGKLGPVKLVLIGLAAWCAALPIVAVACYVGSKLLGAQGSSNPIISLVLDAARSSNSGAILLFYLTLGVLAPLCEESLFRGFLYSSLRRRFGVGVSLLVSASLFAAAHLDPGAVTPLLCLGLVFGFVFERTKSLVPCMIAHGLWNSGSFTVMLLIFGS